MADCGSLGDAGASALALAFAAGFLPRCEHLYLQSNNIGPVGAAALAPALCACSCLHNLYIGNSPIGVGGVQAIAQHCLALPRLRELSLTHCGMGDEGFKALANAAIGSGLEELYADRNGITDVGVEAAIDACKRGSFPRLKYLYLYGNRISDVGMQAMAQALRDGLLSSLEGGYFGWNPGSADVVYKVLRERREKHRIALG